MFPHYHFFFFFNDTATTEIYTLSLHDALPISRAGTPPHPRGSRSCSKHRSASRTSPGSGTSRSEEHTSELQSQSNLVCRLLLEKKKKKEILESTILKCSVIIILNRIIVYSYSM